MIAAFYRFWRDRRGNAITEFGLLAPVMLALFMGLGDVIFPGMLVLSALQWLDPSGAFAVAMSTLVGGLLGYLALMTYVARGQAQAGLPLLNGGAILGYVIGGFLFLNGDVFQFNISW